MNLELENRECGLQELYRAFLPAVYRTAFSLVQEHPMAESVTRDCFVELARSELRFESMRQIQGWLVLTATSRCGNRGAAGLLWTLRRLRGQEGFTLQELASLLRLWLGNNQRGN